MANLAHFGLRFGAITLENQTDKKVQLSNAKDKQSAKAGWESKELWALDAKSGQKDRVAIARQAKDAKTDVKFFQGKGGFSAIVSTDDLNYIALPGSRIELPDTLVELPGAPIEGTSAVSASNLKPAPLQTATDQAMILGAGLATRFEPVSGVTTGFPKPGVPLVGEESVIVGIARQLQKHGIKKIIVNTHYMPETVMQQLKTGVPGMTFIFMDERKLLGTAGGMVEALAQGKVDRKKPILIMQGDAVTDIDLSRLINVHQQTGAKVTIGVQPVDESELDKVGILKTDKSGADGVSGRIEAYIEKPGLDPAKLEQVGDSRMGNIGFYVLSPDVYTRFVRQGKKQFRQGKLFDYSLDFFPNMLRKGPASRPMMWAQKLEGYWNDIGNPKHYFAVVKDIFNGKLNLPLPADIKQFFDNGVIFWPGTKAKVEKAGADVSGNVIVANKPKNA